MRSAALVAALVVALLRASTALGEFTELVGGIRVDATGRECPGAQFNRIQNAIDAVRPGQTILVCPGIYPEQITVTKRVQLRGARGAVVQPPGMVANTTSLRTGRPVAAVAVVTAPASIQGLDFDASLNGLVGCDPSSPLLMGVFFRGSSGSLKSSLVHGVTLGPADRSCDTGAAVVVQSGGGRPIQVALASNLIFDYQRAGVVVNEVGARATLRRNTVAGAGPTPSLAQNGIQVGFGAVAKIERNVVQNNATPSGGDCVFDGGDLFFQSDGGTIARNVFTGNTTGVIVNGSRNRVMRNILDGLSAGTPAGLDGISIFGDRNLVARNQVRNMSQAGIRLAGSRNRALHNTVSETREANLCVAARALPGCDNLLEACGMGVWIAGGSGNRAARNSLRGNDVPLRDDGARSIIRQ